MYQYKGILKSNQEVIAEGHSIQEIEQQILHFRRQQKKGEHTDMNVEVEIYHVKRNHADELIKVA